jgi:hypothetical protein
LVGGVRCQRPASKSLACLLLSPGARGATDQLLLCSSDAAHTRRNRVRDKPEHDIQEAIREERRREELTFLVIWEGDINADGGAATRPTEEGDVVVGDGEEQQLVCRCREMSALGGGRCPRWSSSSGAW